MTKDGEDLRIPPMFSGPPQLLLYTRYGDPREAGWENKWITTWNVQQLHPWFPQKEIRLHKHFRQFLDSAFTALEAAGLHGEIKTCLRGYEVFYLPDSPVLSVHSWGAAIDLNAEENPLGSMGVWSNEFIDLMLKNNVFCGQCWTGVKEPMHFGMVDGE